MKSSGFEFSVLRSASGAKWLIVVAVVMLAGGLLLQGSSTPEPLPSEGIEKPAVEMTEMANAAQERAIADRVRF